MQDNPYRGLGFMKFICTLSFMIFGVVAFMKQGNEWDPVYLIFGVLVGLLFTLLCGILFKLLTGLFNPDTRKAYGKILIAYVVWKGMLFIVPFSVMSFMAAFFLHWNSAGLFISAGIMTSATSVVMEISRYHEKPKIRNSIILPMAASILSMAWLFSVGFLQAIPGLLDTLVSVFLEK